MGYATRRSEAAHLNAVAKKWLHGQCEREPMVDVRLPGSVRVSFGNVDVKGLRRIRLICGKRRYPGELFLLSTALGEPDYEAVVEPEPTGQAKLSRCPT